MIFLEPIQEKLFRDDEDESDNENVVVDKMINEEDREENIAFNEIPDVESKEEWIFTQEQIMLLGGKYLSFQKTVLERLEVPGSWVPYPGTWVPWSGSWVGYPGT